MSEDNGLNGKDKTGNTPRQRAFILELTELTRKYGLAVGGCGCCGSPFLHEVETPPRDDTGYTAYRGTNITWQEPTEANMLGWKSAFHDIIRAEG